MSGADLASEGAKIGPLVKAESDASLGGLYLGVLGAVGLKPLSEVDALIARGDADVVGATDVLP